jgi:hypothetical protein
MKLAHHEADAKNAKMRELDSTKTFSGFTSYRWIFFGLGGVIIGGIGHLAVLPFADVTLLTTVCAFGILFTTMLSICLLGETFVWKYDLVATILVIVGSTLTILQMNIRVDLEYNRERVYHIIVTWKAFGLLIMIIGKSILTIVAYC